MKKFIMVYNGIGKYEGSKEKVLEDLSNNLDDVKPGENVQIGFICIEGWWWPSKNTSGNARIKDAKPAQDSL